MWLTVEGVCRKLFLRILVPCSEAQDSSLASVRPCFSRLSEFIFKIQNTGFNFLIVFPLAGWAKLTLSVQRI